MAPRRLALTTTLAALFLTCAMTAQRGQAPQAESISPDEMRAGLFFLASDAMAGRLTDTPTNGIAADWVRSRFERLGLKPGGQSGSFEHRYLLMAASLGPENRLVIGEIGAGGARYPLGVGHDFYPHRFSASGTAQAGDVCGIRHGLARAAARRRQGQDQGTHRADSRPGAGRQRPGEPV